MTLGNLYNPRKQAKNDKYENETTDMVPVRAHALQLFKGRTQHR